MGISISGQVPAEAQNGMATLTEEWLEDPTPEAVVAVVVIERHGFKHDDTKQERTATMKFRHIEPLTGEAAVVARDLLEEACGVRGGEVLREPEPPTELDIPALDFEEDEE
ncbi:hypothetical protein [Lysinibacter sp. HNR]|uniref:hypothetical protein n=1 Tax=Lysinibacter sp. HNR TaxID=3031408 RepID=UPI002434E55D|nr:hypothetical protein [Lysinibacter sp. HNR]WGD38499.1 hypothetical protein FrondiHNR_06200 [Lysinibacter sp. HNR]